MNEIYNSIISAISRFYSRIGGTKKPHTPQQNPIYNKTPYDIKPVEKKPEGADGESHRYPPYLEGLPALHPKKILEEQKEIVDRIISTCNIEIEMPGLVRKTLENYAAAVHLIPASESHHHADSGGLLRHGLEVANLALLLLNEYAPLARGHFAEQREHLAPRMRYAVLVAALGHDLGKPVTDMSIADDSGKLKWNPMKETLYEWSQKNKVERYFLHWSASRNKKHEPVSVLMLGYVMGAEGREYIAEVDSNMLSQAVESVSGDPSAANVIAKIVKRADSSSTERDQRRRGAGGFGSGMPVERYYLDAMRTLTRKKDWKINKPGGKIWVIGGDAYLVWPAAAEDMQKHFMANKVKGIPFDPITILNELGDRGFLRPRVADMGKQTWIWPIVPNEIKSSLSAPLNSVCLMAQDLLFDIEVQSVDGVKGAEAAAVFEKAQKPEKTEGGKPDKSSSLNTDDQKVTENKISDQGVNTEVAQKSDLLPENDEPKPKLKRTARPSAPKNNDSEQPAKHVQTEKIEHERRVDEKSETHQPYQESGSATDAGKINNRNEKQRANRVPPAEAEKNLKKKGLIGMVLAALAKDLNRRDPEIEILKSRTVGDGNLLLLLRAPEFFKDFHDDEETIKEDALSSKIVQLTEDGALEWIVDDHIWWALNPEASIWFFSLIDSYIARYARNKGKNAPQNKTPARVEDQPGAPGDKEGQVERSETDAQPSKSNTPTPERLKSPEKTEDRSPGNLSVQDEVVSVAEDQYSASDHLIDESTQDSGNPEVNEQQEDGPSRDSNNITEQVLGLLESMRDDGATEVYAKDVVEEIKKIQKRFSLTVLKRLLADQEEFVIDAESEIINLKKAGGDE
jgi:conjugal transfer pilus assembly protein TraI